MVRPYDFPVDICPPLKLPRLVRYWILDYIQATYIRPYLHELLDYVCISAFFVRTTKLQILSGHESIGILLVAKSSSRSSRG